MRLPGRNYLNKREDRAAPSRILTPPVTRAAHFSARAGGEAERYFLPP